MQCEYPEWFKEVRIKALEDAIAEHKRTINNHFECIGRLKEELIALKGEGKENDKQEA